MREVVIQGKAYPYQELMIDFDWTESFITKVFNNTKSKDAPERALHSETLEVLARSGLTRVPEHPCTGIEKRLVALVKVDRYSRSLAEELVNVFGGLPMPASGLIDFAKGMAIPIGPLIVSAPASEMFEPRFRETCVAMLFSDPRWSLSFAPISKAQFSHWMAILGESVCQLPLPLDHDRSRGMVEAERRVA